MSTLEALRSRSDAIRNFGAEELEEIGLLTMRLTALEEFVALFCEILLNRPELGGFHTSQKAIISKQFSEKLGLYSGLTTACGVLHGIDTRSIEVNLASLRAIGEERNAVVHGLLGGAGDGSVAFRSRGHDVQATLAALRDLTVRCNDAASELMLQFSKFYTELPRKKSVGSGFDKKVPALLEILMKLHHSEDAVRTSILNERAAKVNFSAAKEKVDEMRAQLKALKGGNR